MDNVKVSLWESMRDKFSGISLRTKILFSLFLSLLFFFASFIVIINGLNHRSSNKLAQEILTRSKDNLSNLISDYFTERWMDLVTYSEISGLDSKTLQEIKANKLDSMKNNVYEEISVIDINSKYIFSSNFRVIGKTFNELDRKKYLNTQQSFFIKKIKGHLVAFLVYKKSGLFYISQINLTAWFEKLNELNAFVNSKNIFFTIENSSFGPSGSMLSLIDTQQSNSTEKVINQIIKFDNFMNPNISDMHKDLVGVGSKVKVSDNQSLGFIIQLNDSTNFGLFKRDNEVIKYSSLVALLFLAAMLAIGFLYSSTIVGRINKIKLFVQNKEDTKFRLITDVKDEIGELTEGINQFLDYLEEIEKSKNHILARETMIKNELDETVKRLSDTCIKLDDNSKGLAIRMASISQSSSEVQRYIHTVSSASEEMISSIGQISGYTDKAAVMTKDAVNIIDSTEKIILTLQNQSEEIATILKVVTEIANQTNLLALNATIEAARAGEAGKGFAVVANEVKDLAARTAEATEDIGAKISGIQNETLNALGAFGTAANSVKSINEIAVTIANSVVEQTAVTSEIGKSMRNSAEKVEEMAYNISEISTLVKGNSERTQDIQIVTNRLQKLNSVK